VGHGFLAQGFPPNTERNPESDAPGARFTPNPTRPIKNNLTLVHVKRRRSECDDLVDTPRDAIATECRTPGVLPKGLSPEPHFSSLIRGLSETIQRVRAAPTPQARAINLKLERRGSTAIQFTAGSTRPLNHLDPFSEPFATGNDCLNLFKLSLTFNYQDG